jgi:CheY-like chemotaxis protein
MILPLGDVSSSQNSGRINVFASSELRLNGLEAIQKARELQPDVILLDIGLPKLTGIVAAQKIRNVAPNSKYSS